MGALDAIIIGSGFSGSFCAGRLVPAGLRVAMVERGPWRDTISARRAGVAERSPLPHKRHMLSHFLNRLSSPQPPGTGWVFNPSGSYGVHRQRAMNTPPAVNAYWDNRADGLNNQAMAKFTNTPDCLSQIPARFRPPRAPLPR